MLDEHGLVKRLEERSKQDLAFIKINFPAKFATVDVPALLKPS